MAYDRIKNNEKMRKYRASLKAQGRVAKHETREMTNERMKAWNRKWRKAVLDLLGGVCVRCGFSDPRALQIDHVQGDGWKEKGKGFGRQGTYYKRIASLVETGRYQLLCANCNWIKRAENGEVA